MQTAKLKTYAPKARRDFIAAVTRRAAKLGITAKGVSPIREEGQLVFIEGQPYPKSVGAQRAKLAKRIAQQGFKPVMEAVAYTWFNRFAAIRFMELHGYLDHSFRVLSHPGGSALPEILEHAQHLDLPGLDRARVLDLKLDGTRDEDLYRDLLLAQCRALHQAMPFLFESVDDETELLLPENLLQTDSLFRELVTAIPEDDWQEIEIIGWLYQFYISEKKDQVIGKVVKSEDIPAATQLFTPNWIVKYMVQNSFGAQWLATYPDSPLKGQMEYYIEPAEQTPEVQAQLDAIIPKSLNPEELTFIDPACGSGHILVEAYELFKAIYLERGYRLRDIPRLILEKNLFGLDIDGRAAQLAGFALMMKARADDRRLFERGVRLNVMAFEEVVSDEWRVVSEVAADAGLSDTIEQLVSLFEHAKTFGSLIQVPQALGAKLPALRQLIGASSQDLFISEALKRLGPLVQQAEVLAKRYDAVVANPPYMGSKYYCQPLSEFIDVNYKPARPDIYACFVLAGLRLCRPAGRIANINIPGWMMNSTFSEFRSELMERSAILSLIHNGRGVFGSDFGSCVFTIFNYPINSLLGRYRSLFDKASAVATNENLMSRFKLSNDYLVSPIEFKAVQDAPLSYQVTHRVRMAYRQMPLISEIATACQGLSTSSDLEFVRVWHEVDVNKSSWSKSDGDAATSSKWFPYNKGGNYRKWYGNVCFVLNWEHGGAQIKKRKPQSVIRNERYYFQESISWQDYTIGASSFRLFPEGFIFATNAHSAFFGDDKAILPALGFCNSVVLSAVAAAVSPGLHFNSGYFSLIPFDAKDASASAGSIAGEAVQIARDDWDAYERSWAFRSLPILAASPEPTTIVESRYIAWAKSSRATIAEMKRLEEENNRLFIEAYGLQDELTPEVPIEQITLTVNPAYRYGKKLESGEWSVESGFGQELETRFREDTMKELVSYAIGCVMGRYRLDRPGLIYAHSGNERFWEVYEGEVTSGEWSVASKENADAAQDCDTSAAKQLTTYHSPLTTSFKPDADGIIPITDTDWFDDDATHRLVEFIAVAFGEVDSGEWIVDSEDGATSKPPLSTNHYPLSTKKPLSTKNLEENLSFLANNLSPKKDESSRDTIRRYLCDSFFKDHLQTYKKRPIYWCFTSGKQKAFQCLVYLHRYHEGTLARMRMEYVVPLQSKMAARIDKLSDDIQSASTSAQAKRLQKERDKLVKQLDELRRFDEQLRHYADQRIALDLDDGVKVNYGKFGDLLAEVKAVTGKGAD